MTSAASGDATGTPQYTLAPMSRLPLADPAQASDPSVLATFGEIQRELGFGMVPNLFRAMAQNPAVLAANWAKFRATVLEGALPRTTKEMVGIVVSAVNGSEYARAVHLHSLGVQGVDAATLASLGAGELDAAPVSDALRAVLRFAERAARDPRSVGDDDYRALRDAGLSEAEVFEVVAAVDLFSGVNAFTDAIDLEVDEI